jgi:hypothetical protein
MQRPYGPDPVSVAVLGYVEGVLRLTISRTVVI